MEVPKIFFNTIRFLQRQLQTSKERTMMKCCFLAFLTLLLRTAYSQAPGSCSSCTEDAELDFFHLYTSIAKQTELLSIPLNEAPRTPGSVKYEPSFQFSGKHWLKDRGSSALSSVVCGMCARHEVTFHFSLLFLNDELGGPLLQMSHEVSSLFTIDVKPKGNLISVYYLHQNRLVVEKFSVDLKIGLWYKVAVHFSGNLLKLFVNCELADSRSVLIPDYCIQENSVSVLVGKNSKTEYYNGSLQGVRVIASATPLNKQCPDMDADKVNCPVCGSLLTTLKKLKTEQEKVAKLEEELASAIFNATNCTSELKAPAKCEIESTLYNSGSFAKKSNGEICFCEDGNAKCVNPDSLQVAPTPIQPVVVSTVIPSPTSLAQEQGNTQNMCGQKTVLNKVIDNIPIGEADYTKNPTENKCIINKCVQGITSVRYDQTIISCSDLRSDDCSSLATDEERNLYVCCGTCRACDFASCPANSQCANVPPSFECRCISGYMNSADSSECIDIDECSLPEDNENRHDCPAGSTCANTVGAFTCNCPEFYTIGMVAGKKQCVDIDECSDGSHTCPAGTQCENKEHGFDCTCMKGYVLEDNKCKPVCDPPCEYGNCTEPGVCECIEGYTGSRCDQDIDECKTGDRCPNPPGAHNITMCINTFGGFFCTCATGLQRVHKDDGTATCSSIDECSTGLHFCPPKSECLNTLLGYACRCTSGECDGKCQVGRDTLDNGEIRTAGCDVCTCKNGDYTCERLKCNCSSNTRQISECCPECSRENYCYDPQGLALKVGEQRYKDACTFDSCELVDGKATLVPKTTDCPALTCPLDKQYTPDGTCCPVCSLPTCTSMLNGRTVETSSNGNCAQCSCNADDTNKWSCTSVPCSSRCPSLGDCSTKHITSLSLNDCPVCLTSASQLLSEPLCTS